MIAPFGPPVKPLDMVGRACGEVYGRGGPCPAFGDRRTTEPRRVVAAIALSSGIPRPRWPERRANANDSPGLFAAISRDLPVFEPFSFTGISGAFWKIRKQNNAISIKPARSNLVATSSESSDAPAPPAPAPARSSLRPRACGTSRRGGRRHEKRALRRHFSADSSR
jgi:hypothetical protein